MKQNQDYKELVQIQIRVWINCQNNCLKVLLLWNSGELLYASLSATAWPKYYLNQCFKRKPKPSLPQLNLTPQCWFCLTTVYKKLNKILIAKSATQMWMIFLTIKTSMDSKYSGISKSW